MSEYLRYKQIDFYFASICRIFISGSSSAGKTHFTYELLKAKYFDYDQIIYCHPDFHNEKPVEWHIPGVKLFFQPGVPTKKDILDLPPNTVLVLDDLFQTASESLDIDYLFRVLSGKRKIHVIIMTQRYFVNTKFAMSIRNSSNYHVLMNNADATVNLTAGRKMGLKTEITRAIELNQSKPYPYIFIDRTAAARSNGFSVFIELFGIKEVVIGKMRYFMITESDFNSNFKQVGDNIATRDGGNKEKTLSKPTADSSGEKKTTGDWRNQYHSHYSRKRQVERQINKALRRYQKRSEL